MCLAISPKTLEGPFTPMAGFPPSIPCELEPDALRFLSDDQSMCVIERAGIVPN